jgi:hypothetical protein
MEKYILYAQFHILLELWHAEYTDGISMVSLQNHLTLKVWIGNKSGCPMKA